MDVKATDNAEKGEVKRWKGHRITGIGLSIVGFLWLARKMGWMPHDSVWVQHHATGGIFLPVLLIASGLMLIFGMFGDRKRHSK